MRSAVIRDESSRTHRHADPPRGRAHRQLGCAWRVLSDAALQSLLNLVAIGLERALAQEAVNRAKVARQSEELKSTLLDAIAHEFKTPLTSIKAVTTDLLSEPANELKQHQRELISIADEGTDRLSRLVTDAIQLARIEGGTFRLNRGIYFPSSLVSAALRQMKSLMDGREIKVSAPDDLPPVRVDAELIQMVIAHLLDNALKYSPPGSAISVGACTRENKVTIYVNDRGPGIKEDEQPRIFEKFYRGKNDRNLKGTGMGLAIAREIIRAHGEEIWVTSKPGQGSEFSFSLPVAPPSSCRMSAGRILVIDDDPQIRRAMRTTLTAHGYQVGDARTGEEGLEELRSTAYDLVLLDMNMPGMGGIETCRLIRSGSDVAIIMLTVSNTEKNKVDALDAGADDYITKPFSMPELLARIRATLRRLPQPPGQADLEPLTSKGVEIDLSSRQVTVRGRLSRLTAREFDLLSYLLARPNKTIAHREILQAVWGPDYGDELEYLRVFVNRLRKKIEPDPSKPQFLVTDAWAGYRFHLPQ